MKKTILVATLFLFSNFALAGSKVTVSIDELNNVYGNGAIEACGTVKHAEGKKPLLVTLTHDASKYTTLGDENGKWCVVIKRWTNSGTVTATASTLDFAEKSDVSVR